MNMSNPRDDDRAGATFRPLSMISVSLLLAVLGVVLFITLRAPLKDDIAWLLYVARRWMGGQELYVDLFEVNPPLIIWISAIPLEIANWLHVRVQLVAMPLFIAAVLGCAWWCASLLRDRRGLDDRLPVFAVIGSALLVLPAADIGQREHLLVAAFLPYLVLFARSLEGRRNALAVSLGAGVLAGIGCALKPRYGAVFAVLECLALSRGLRPWRMMPVAAGATLLGYSALVAILWPAYFQRAVPLALALYGATDVPFLALVSDSALLLAGECVAAGLLWLRRRTLPDHALMLTLVVFAATSTVICFVDGKDWYYHRLPATLATVLALALWVVTEVRQRGWAMRPTLAGAPLAAACLAVLVFCASSVRQMTPAFIEAVKPQPNAVTELERIIQHEHARTYVAFSEWIALGFPVVNNTGVSWASRFDSMWALKGEVWRARFDPATATEWPAAREIAVVDTRETTHYVSVLSLADPAFARAWSRYRPIAAFNGLVVYKRGRGGCRDVWVAAGAETGIQTR